MINLLFGKHKAQYEGNSNHLRSTNSEQTSYLKRRVSGICHINVLSAFRFMSFSLATTVNPLTICRTIWMGEETFKVGWVGVGGKGGWRAVAGTPPLELSGGRGRVTGGQGHCPWRINQVLVLCVQNPHVSASAALNPFTLSQTMQTICYQGIFPRHFIWPMQATSTFKGKSICFNHFVENIYQ